MSTRWVSIAADLYSQIYTDRRSRFNENIIGLAIIMYIQFRIPIKINMDYTAINLEGNKETRREKKRVNGDDDTHSHTHTHTHSQREIFQTTSHIKVNPLINLS